MKKTTAIQAIHKINRLIFTTREIASLTGSTVSSTTQSLRRMEEAGLIKKIIQGVWGFVYDRRFSPLLVIPFLTPHHRSYLSFISALHAHGVISQIPQVITVASTTHSKKVKTPVGIYHIHQISPDFFDGFDWHSSGDFLIASPEKSLVDCLYLANRKGRQYAHFPELDLTPINRSKVQAWANKINDARIRKPVVREIKRLLATNRHLTTRKSWK